MPIFEAGTPEESIWFDNNDYNSLKGTGGGVPSGWVNHMLKRFTWKSLQLFIVYSSKTGLPPTTT